MTLNKLTRVLFFVLFLPYGKSGNPLIRIISQTSKDSVSTGELNSTVLKYSDQQVVHFSCVTGDGSSATLNWQIVDNKSLKGCGEEINVKEINYITQLTKSEHGKHILCKSSNTKGRIGHSYIILESDTCSNDTQKAAANRPAITENDTPKVFHANCPAITQNTPLATYVDGIFSTLPHRTAVFSKDQTLTIHCQMNDNEKYRLEWKPKNMKGLEKLTPSINVISLKIKMSEEWDDQKLLCVKKDIKEKKTVSQSEITFKLISNFFIEVILKNSQKVIRTERLYRKYTKLKYRDHEFISLSCYNNNNKLTTLNWKIDGPIKNEVTNIPKTWKKIKFQASLSRANNNSLVTCENKLNDNKPPPYTRAIRLIFDDGIADGDPKGDADEIVGSNGTKTSSFDIAQLQWILVGIIIAILVMIIVFLTIKRRRLAGMGTGTNAVSYENFQNSEIEPPPRLEPTYSGPVDSCAYAYATTKPQHMYSTPFVPTVEEMYTQPTPKRLKPVQPKVKYSNLRPKDPGYSNLMSENAEDYSTLYTYSVPE